MSGLNHNSALPNPLIPHDHWLARTPSIASAAGIVGLLGAASLTRHDPKQFFFSYLFAFVVVMSLSLGGLFFVLIQLATRAGWSVTVRRLAEHAMAPLPFAALLLLPVFLGLKYLYPWMDPEAVKHSEILQWKATYLNQNAFVIRSFCYLLIWSATVLHFRKNLLLQDKTGDPEITRTLQRHAPLGLIGFALTITFASFDWIMSLQPIWHSTIFGVYYFAGGLTALLAFMALLIVALRSLKLVDGAITVEHQHDVGKLLFAFNCFWAYIAFSQFMLMWYANIPDETEYYRMRWTGSWQTASLVLLIGHFIVPFFLLMSRHAKRNSAVLALGAGWIMLMHLLDMYWLIMPSLTPAGFAPSLPDLFAMVGVGGLWLAQYLRQLTTTPLWPVRDPRLPEALAFENE